ncbi:uncharacterized protein LOC108669091 [Hyalella azteca]|uniref:Uncharacterized protein LOC108669091 n=1 Tax=Hyalella azteca TaxID=294128 RepID=A0A8B7NE31_HYAAZ|nr:uncharacterized protein LOC108669091 [Hyalella azteca]
MVVPLFGLQFLLTIYRPGSSACKWTNFYHILNHIIEGSTGMLVAVIFCYMNSEVRTLLKRSCHCLTEELESRGILRLRDNTHARSRYSMSTVHTIVPDTNVNTGAVKQFHSHDADTHFNTEEVNNKRRSDLQATSWLNKQNHSSGIDLNQAAKLKEGAITDTIIDEFEGQSNIEKVSGNLFSEEISQQSRNTPSLLTIEEVSANVDSQDGKEWARENSPTVSDVSKTSNRETSVSYVNPAAD